MFEWAKHFLIQVPLLPQNQKLNKINLIWTDLCEFGGPAVGELTAQVDGPIRICRDLILHSNTLTPDRYKKTKEQHYKTLQYESEQTLQYATDG